jgi:hypothetical protein
MTPFSNPQERQHVSDVAEHSEAAARILTSAAKRIRNGESVRDVFGSLIDTVIALSGRV